jgi:hypothetical protein
VDGKMNQFLSTIDFLQENPAEPLLDAQGEINSISVSQIIATLTGVIEPRPFSYVHNGLYFFVLRSTTFSETHF